MPCHHSEEIERYKDGKDPFFDEWPRYDEWKIESEEREEKLKYVYPSSGEEFVSKAKIKPLTLSETISDNRQFKYYKLENQMDVVVVSDPQAK